MARVFNLGDVFELVIDRFTDAAFAQQQLVKLRHQPFLHALLEFRDELHAVGEKLLKERLRNIAFVAEELAKEMFDQPGNDGAVIHVACRDGDTEQFAAIVHDQV